MNGNSRRPGFAGGTRMNRLKIPVLCVDFDGVIHSYSSGWRGARNIPDPPVEGAVEWLISLIAGGKDGSPLFSVQIYSSRSRYFGGRRAIRKWLLRWGLTGRELARIKFPRSKPAAFLQIDDRALTFTGKFPSVEEMLSFKPWHKRGV